MRRVTFALALVRVAAGVNFFPPERMNRDQAGTVGLRGEVERSEVELNGEMPLSANK